VEPGDLATLKPDAAFDGGTMDCGSGLILLIRESMQRVPLGGVLEMRSREPTVGSDLPPWCRLVGHEYLGSLPDPAAEGGTRYYIRRGQAAASEDTALASDLDRARAYEWRARVRSTGPLRAQAYCRNFSFNVGQAASFEEKDEHPSAIEYVLGALGGELSTIFGDECARRDLVLDDVEIVVKARLHDVLAHMGMTAGDCSIAGLEARCFASTMEAEESIAEAWNRALERAPLYSTLRKAADITARLRTV